MKLSKMLAVASVLACSSLALAQDNQTTDLATFAQTLSTVAAFIWFILFVKWGGLRWLY